jgi:selenocysteine lyase/cysteine desulfurase
MSLDRREFLVRTGMAVGGAAAGAGALAGAEQAADRLRAAPSARPSPPLDTWAAVRAQFALTRDRLHFGGLLLASHPAPVAMAIERHRRGLDADPVGYLHQHQDDLEAAVRDAAGSYLEADPRTIALTDSTTMGLGLLYRGLDLGPGQEALTTRHDFLATHESLRYATGRTGSGLRFVSLYDQDRAGEATGDGMVAALLAAVTPRTRVVAVTWVHSSSGVRLPVARIAAELARLNADRAPADRALLCVDGVHGLGVEDATVAALGCDFLAAGCHKWLFGPRGTGILWGARSAWPRFSPTIPTFSGTGQPGLAATPGGFHSFEHRWALAEAFDFHLRIGKARIAERIHALNRQLKEGLRSMAHVTLHTPLADSLSAGLVVFDVAGLKPAEVVDRLARRGITATTTPYDPSHPRLAPGLLNTPDEVDRVLREIRALA